MPAPSTSRIVNRRDGAILMNLSAWSELAEAEQRQAQNGSGRTVRTRSLPGPWASALARQAERQAQMTSVAPIPPARYARSRPDPLILGTGSARNKKILVLEVPRYRCDQ